MKFEIPFRFILPLTICFQKCFLYYLCFYRPQRSWGKVIFSEACVKNSVHGGGVPGQVHLPWAGTPPGRYTTQTGTQAGTPSRQVHSPAGTPPQVYPLAGTPPGRQVHPLGRYPLIRYPLVRYPPGQVPTPPQTQCMLGDTGNKRAVRILLECNLVIYLRCTFLLNS